MHHLKKTYKTSFLLFPQKCGTFLMEPSECEQKSAKAEVLGIVEPDVGGQIFGLSIQFLRFMSNKEYCE